MDDKYGVDDDPYCYPGTTVLRNKLNLQNEDLLDQAERELSEIAASTIGFEVAPYSAFCSSRSSLTPDRPWIGGVSMSPNGFPRILQQ